MPPRRPSKASPGNVVRKVTKRHQEGCHQRREEASDRESDDDEGDVQVGGEGEAGDDGEGEGEEGSHLALVAARARCVQQMS